MKIIPAIDIYKGKCVRLVKGDYNLKKEYSSDPLIIAKEFERIGDLIAMPPRGLGTIFTH